MSKHKNETITHYDTSFDEWLIDTHAHLYDERYAEENATSEDILDRAIKAGVKGVIVPADSIKTSGEAVDFVRKFNGRNGIHLWCSVGIHPHEASSYDDNCEAYLRTLLDDRDNNRIVAIGEIGLDYFYEYSDRPTQKAVFEKQLELAYEYDIPFILHERDASADCLEILKRFHENSRLRAVPGVCHCCSCSSEIARELVKLGFYLGFDGPLTFKNNKKSPQTVEETPLDRLLCETDSPYLTPEPNRGRTNEPEFVPFVACKIASVKNISEKEVFEALTQNAKKLFELDRFS